MLSWVVGCIVRIDTGGSVLGVSLGLVGCGEDYAEMVGGMWGA